MRNEGRSGGVGSSGHGRGGGGGRDAAAVSSHIEEQAERLEYARRATQLEKVKGVFIGKKNTCWVAQWTDSTGKDIECVSTPALICSEPECRVPDGRT